jgi:hypothetical protein
LAPQNTTASRHAPLSSSHRTAHGPVAQTTSAALHASLFPHRTSQAPLPLQAMVASSQLAFPTQRISHAIPAGQSRVSFLQSPSFSQEITQTPASQLVHSLGQLVTLGSAAIPHPSSAPLPPAEAPPFPAATPPIPAAAPPIPAAAPPIPAATPPVALPPVPPLT